MLKNSALKLIAHSKKVLKIAVEYGWLPGARYTNLRDIRDFDRIGLIDIDWENYNFCNHLKAVKETCPILTVAQDIVNIEKLDEIVDQANQLSEYAKYVIVVPKDERLCGKLENIIPSNFILGYSVPTRYGGTSIQTSEFTRPVHLLGGRPDVQIRLAKEMDVFSFDCNRFTIDAAYGYFFNGFRFVKHPKGGYEQCIRDSFNSINMLWETQRGSNKERENEYRLAR